MRASFNFFNALRTVALRDVLAEPSDYHLRHVFRWFSRNFHVPLPEVAHLPLDYVLQNFYEAKYEDMDPDQREEERQLLIETDEARFARLMKEDADSYEDRQFEEEANRIAEQQDKQTVKGDDKLMVPNLPNVNLPTMLDDLRSDPLAPPTDGKVLPGIKMKFEVVSQDELSRRIEALDREEMDQTDLGGNLPKASQGPHLI